MSFPSRLTSPPPGPPSHPPTSLLCRSRSSFAGDNEHYERWTHFMESTFNELEGNSLRVVSESGQRYSPLQHVLAPFSGEDHYRHRFGGIWSETPAFLTTMIRAGRLNISEGFPPARPQVDQAKEDRIGRWLSALVENNEKFGAAPPPQEDDGSDSGGGAKFDAPPPDDSGPGEPPST